jgi:hypothetical protein
MAIDKLKRHKSLGVDQIPAELAKAEGRIIGNEIHKLINPIWNTNELPEWWKSRSLYQLIRRAIKQIVVNIEPYQFC